MGEMVAKVVIREKRRDTVMELALSGASTREIARQVNCSHGTVARDIKDRLKAGAQNGSTRRYRELHRQRIAALLSQWWNRAADDITVLDRVIKLLEREARLLGLDTPVTQAIDLHHQGGIMIAPALVSPDEWVERQNDRNASKGSPIDEYERESAH